MNQEKHTHTHTQNAMVKISEVPCAVCIRVLHGHIACKFDINRFAYLIELRACTRIKSNSIYLVGN